MKENTAHPGPWPSGWHIHPEHTMGGGWEHFHVMHGATKVATFGTLREAQERVCADLAACREALGWLLPMAEAYMRGAPSHPDNAKLETARALLARLP